MVKLSIDYRGVTDQFLKLAQSVEDAIRPAAHAGAQIYYDEMRARVSQLGRVTGNLLDSIYQKWVPEQSSNTKSTYNISWRKKRTEGYDAPKTKARVAIAPHGFLVEYGHIARYQAVIATTGRFKGQWITLVRPEMRGKPKPKRRASQAQKDAYYVQRKGGPLQVAARPFLRGTFDAKSQSALSAAAQTMKQRIGAKA